MGKSVNTIIHKSSVLLAFKIILLELILELTYLMITNGAKLIFGNSQGGLSFISPLGQLLLLPMQILILVLLLMRWSTETYEIRGEEIIIKTGILKRTEISYPYKNMQSVIVRQSILERIFRAGSISVFVPTLGKDIIFHEVANPRKFAENIKESIPPSEKSQYIMSK